MKKLFTLALCTAALFCACSRGELKNNHECYEHSKIDTVDNQWFTMNIDICLPSAETFNEEDVDAEISIHKRVREDMVADFMGNTYLDMSVNSMLKAYTDTAWNYYIISNKEYQSYGDDEEMNTVMRYAEDLTIYPHSSCSEYINYVRDLYIYQGGAHGLITNMFAVYDINNGERMTLRHLFSKEQLADIKTELGIAADKLRHDGKLPESDEYFNNSIIEATENFYLGDSTITFHYNPYDIAPYSCGAVELTVKR